MSAHVELYHTNTKKSQDPTTQFEFAVFMIDASKSYHIPAPTPGSVTEVEKVIEKCDNGSINNLVLMLGRRRVCALCICHQQDT